MSVKVQLFEQTALRPSKAAPRVEELVGGGFDAGKFVENFEVFAEAVGSVREFRRLVLTLALQGRLSRCAARDGSASDVLKKVTADRSWRIEERPSKPKFDPKIEALVGVTPVPEAWAECRLNDFAQLINGRAYAQPELLSAGTPVIRIQNLNGGNDWYYSDLALPERQYCDTGDLLFAWSASFGPYIWVGNKAIYHYHIWKLNLSEAVDKRFLYFSLLHITDVVREQSHGLAMLHMTKGQMERWPILLPPLAEQQRIVAKVDHLMALCDELEVRQSKKYETGTRLTKSALEALTSAEGPEEFDAAWKRMVENFDVLVERPESITDLRGAIGNLAIRGALTKRGLGEEPARLLLERIEVERQRRVRAKETRRAEPLPSVSGEEVPFPLPPSWSWARLGHLCWKVADGPHYSPKYVAKEEGVPFLSGRNIKVGGFDLESVKYVASKDHRTFCERVKPEPGDVLYTKGGTTGVALVNDLGFEFSVWVHVAVLKLDLANISPHYVSLALNSPHCYAQSQKFTHGTGNRDLGLTRMVLITVPLPPLEEQKRIVAKVSQLMNICHRLEASMRQAEDRAAKLVEAVVQELVA